MGTIVADSDVRHLSDPLVPNSPSMGTANDDLRCLDVAMQIHDSVVIPFLRLAHVLHTSACAICEL